MPEVALTTLVTYPRTSAVARRLSKVVAKHVGMPEGLRAPKRALMTLYGFQDAREEVARAMQQAAREKRACVPVVLRVSVNEIVSGLTDSARLPEVEFANALRLKREALDKLIASVNELRGQTGSRSPYETVNDLGLRPDVLCQVLEREYPRLKIFVFPVAEGKRVRKVAALFRSSGVRIEQPTNHGIEIELPPLRP